MSVLTFGFERNIARFAVIRWWFCDARGALLQHTGILKVETTIFTLALPSASTVRDGILLIWTAGVKRVRGFSFILRAFPCQLSIAAASLGMIVTINMRVTGVDRQAAGPLAPVSSFLVPLFIQFKYAICLASATQWAHTVAAGPGVHPSMYTEGPSARHPLQLQQSSFHKPKPDPPPSTFLPPHSCCLITPSQLTPPPSTNKGEPTMWPKVRGLLQPAKKNREGGKPWPRPAAAPNKHEKTQKMKTHSYDKQSFWL